MRVKILVDRPDLPASLRSRRHEKKLSIMDVAEQAEISYQYLSKLERGETPVVSEQVLRKIGTVLEFDFIGGGDE